MKIIFFYVEEILTFLGTVLQKKKKIPSVNYYIVHSYYVIEHIYTYVTKYITYKYLYKYNVRGITKLFINMT